jgi:hypothetical protein
VTICVFCESEADLAIDGIPLCEECSGKPESKIRTPKTVREIRAALQREILESTARADAASKELIAIMGDIPSGLPQPDGSVRIQNAAHALAAARKAMMQAHSRLNDFADRGVFPEDFESGGSA